MSMKDPNETFSQLGMVLDLITTLRHLVFGSVTTDMLYSIGSKLPTLETLCATAVYDRNTSNQP